MTESLRLTVSAIHAGSRLDQFLAGPLGSRSAAQRKIDAGLVRVDRRRRPKRHVLHGGEEVEVEPQAPADPAPSGSEPRLSIPYEDEYLLVVDKPAGVVVHPSRGHHAGTLAQSLGDRARGGEDAARPGIVHRLDRDTSGLLVVAKSEEVHRALKSLLSTRRLHREYAALVEGHLSARGGTIDAPIGRHPRDRLRMSIGSVAPRQARTHFEIERVLPSSTLVRVELETGRTHQIRVHMAAIGHPVCGDPLYGTVGRFGLRRQFLHARRLCFTHPVTGAPVDVRSELPAELGDALRRAEAG